MIRAFFTFCGWIIKGMVLLIVLFLTLCMDVFTIPIFIILWAFCKLLKLRTPRLRAYGLMGYPSWSNHGGRTLRADVREIERNADRRAKRHVPYSIEEMYLYDLLFGDK